MTDNDDRMTRLERRLDALGEDVGVLKDDVRVLKDDVGVVRNEVGRLRVLYEDHDTKIDAIAEAQTHHARQLEEHGTLLREIKRELVPLGDLRDFVRRIAEEHEGRLSALENHTGIHQQGGSREP
jgi:chromosome segregation ATPase